MIRIQTLYICGQRDLQLGNPLGTTVPLDLTGAVAKLPSCLRESDPDRGDAENHSTFFTCDHGPLLRFGQTATRCLYLAKGDGMKSHLVLFVGLLLAQPVLADFIDQHDRLFRNQNLCDSSLVDQVNAEQDFKKMFATLKNDDEQERPSIIEVMDFGAYTTILKNKTSGVECAIILHDDCYSAYCH